MKKQQVVPAILHATQTLVHVKQDIVPALAICLVIQNVFATCHVMDITVLLTTVFVTILAIHNVLVIWGNMSMFVFVMGLVMAMRVVRLAILHVMKKPLVVPATGLVI